MNKKFRFKKVVALLMVICCIASLCPFTVKGDEMNTTGTDVGIMLTSSTDGSEEESEGISLSTEALSNSLKATANSENSEESVTYTASDVTYDGSAGNFSTTIRIGFAFNGNGSSYSVDYYDADLINNSDYDIAYRIQLPDGAVVPSSLLKNAAYNGYLSADSSTIGFKYYFDSETDGEGNTIYYVYIVFLNKIKLEAGEQLKGYITYGGYFDSDAYDEDEDCINIKDSTSGDSVITVEGSEITYPGNSTATKDISTIKSGSYDSSTNTITYSVIVYSQKGTGDTIELTDAFTDSRFSEILSNGGELTSISCEKTTVTYTTSNNEDHNVAAASGGTEVTLTEDSTATTAPYYYTDSDGTIHIVLAGLNEGSAEKDVYGNTHYTSNAYVITYTFTVDPKYQTTYLSTNSVTATTDYAPEYEGTISDTDTSTVYVKGSTVIEKTGDYDSKGTITWTITVGDGQKELEDYALSDAMFSGLTTDDFTITDANGDKVTGDSVTSCYRASETDRDGNVTYTYYSDAEMTKEINEGDLADYAIVYILNSGDDTVSTILFYSGTQYTIMYTTELDDVWTSQRVTNTAELNYEGSNEGEQGDFYTSTSRIDITGTGTKAFSKKCDNVEETEDDEGNVTLVFSWTTTFTVPETGIPKGTVFTDYVSDSQGSTTHYITYAQAQDIVAAVNAAWGSENISIEFSTKSYSGSTSSLYWVSADSLDSTGSTLYYQFRYTLLSEVEYDTETAENNTISYSYETTANPTGYDSIIYYNSITDGSNSQYGEHTWYSKVAKYGINASGDIAKGDSKISSSVDDDGNVTVSWVVRLAVASGTTYTVTDTLPPNVTLSALRVSKEGNLNYSDIDITDYGKDKVTTTVSGIGTFVAAGSTDTSGNEVVTLKISDVGSDVSVLYLLYTCTYAAGTDAEGTSTELTNDVKVTTGDNDEPYGDASQTTTVIIPTTTTEVTDLTKESVFDSANNALVYTVDINPESETYTAESSGEAYSDLTVTDTLVYYSFPGQELVRSATLITSSLKLLDAETGEELDESEYSWTYSEDVVTYDWGYTVECITHTITLTVPNSRHLTLRYEYSFTIVHNSIWSENTTNATNTATLSADGDTIYTTPEIYDSHELSDVQTYGETSAGSITYTIYKVDEDNFSVKLSGATYTLYVYDVDTSDFAAVGDYTTGADGSVTLSGSPEYDSSDSLVSYSVSAPDREAVSIPVDTICYYVETEAPEDYKLDYTKHYFFYGSSISKSASDCTGYTDSVSNARNMLLSSTAYVTNAHSSDYYADKTSLAVHKTWLDEDGNEQDETDGSITFDLYRVLVLNDGTITSVAEQEGTDVDEAQPEPEEETESGGTSAKEGEVTLSWTLEDAMGISSSGSYSVEASVDNTKTVTLSISWLGLEAYPDWEWFAQVDLYKGSDAGGELLARFNDQEGVCWEDSEDSKVIYDTSGLVTKMWIDYTDYTYNFTIVLTESVELYCAIGDCIIGYGEISDLVGSVINESGDTGAGTEPETDPETGQEPAVETDYSGSKYKELVGSYTITAEDGWSWSSAELSYNYLDTETFETLGYFVYFVVEHPIYNESGELDGEGNYPLAYTTTYTNNTGITDGTIGITNQAVYVPKGSVTLKKVDSEDTDKVLEGAVFTIYSDAECTEVVGIMTTDENGTATYNRLPLGTYWVKETQAPDGYTITSTDPIEVELTEDGQVYDLGDISNDMDDTPVVEKTGSITIIKYGPDGETALSGVTFLCESVTDGITYSTELTTGKDGTVKFEDLAAGTYSITETATQSGLSLLAEPITVTIPLELTAEEVAGYGSQINLENAVEKDGMYYFYDLTYEVTDGVNLQLPASGGNGMPVVWVLLAVMLLLLGFCILTFRKLRV